jgi:hypothetical protein
MSGAKPGHLGVPKATFGIPGQSVPNRDCPRKTGTVGQLGNIIQCLTVLTTVNATPVFFQSTQSIKTSKHPAALVPQGLGGIQFRYCSVCSCSCMGLFYGEIVFTVYVQPSLFL